jgi:hypothetical protein
MSRAQLTSTVEQNTAGAASPFVAGKNKIINGDFGIWQRGTSFANSLNGAYSADRFLNIYDGTGATRAISQQTFTPGTAPVAGYESKYFFRFNQTVAGTGGSFNIVEQPIEDVQTYAGQTISISFWVKSDSSRVIGNVDVGQNFGSGGSGFVATNATLTTGSTTVGSTWQRITYSVSVPGISGKTIGTSSSLNIRIWLPANSTFTLDFWGVQVESGSVATPFTTATGTLQGELAAAMRYYQAIVPTTSYQDIIAGSSNDQTTWCRYPYKFPVPMRVVPTLGTTGTATDYMNLVANGAANASSVPSLTNGRTDGCCINLYSASITTGQGTSFRNSTSTSTNWLTFSAEL